MMESSSKSRPSGPWSFADHSPFVLTWFFAQFLALFHAIDAQPPACSGVGTCAIVCSQIFWLQPHITKHVGKAVLYPNEICVLLVNQLKARLCLDLLAVLLSQFVVYILHGTATSRYLFDMKYYALRTGIELGPKDTIQGASGSQRPQQGHLIAEIMRYNFRAAPRRHTKSMKVEYRPWVEGFGLSGELTKFPQPRRNTESQNTRLNPPDKSIDPARQ